MKLKICWNNKLSNLLFIIFSPVLIAQDGEILEITKHVGYTLDAQENLHYKVFNDIPNFESAQFFEISPQKIEARISFVEYTNIKTSRRSFSLKEFSDMQFRLKNNSKITDAIRESFRKNLTYLRPFFNTITDVLEPSCGSGEYIIGLQELNHKITITGIELNKTIFNQIQHLTQPDITLINDNFLTYFFSN